MMNCSQMLIKVINSLNDIEIKGYSNIKTLSNIIEVLTMLAETQAKDENVPNKNEKTETKELQKLN